MIYSILHGTTLMVLGKNPKVVADQLGHSHSPVQVTLDIYSHVSMELQRQTANKFEQDFFKDNVQFSYMRDFCQLVVKKQKIFNPLSTKGLKLPNLMIREGFEPPTPTLSKLGGELI